MLSGTLPGVGDLRHAPGGHSPGEAPLLVVPVIVISRVAKVLLLVLWAGVPCLAGPRPSVDIDIDIGIDWDRSTLTLVERGAIYARMIRIRDGRILCAYERGGRVWTRRSADNGKTWDEAVLAAEYPFGTAANPEILELRNRRILLSYNERPRDGTHPFTIRVCLSRDKGDTWKGHATVYTADTRPENGCWEPAQVQLPSGEIQLFFANENPYRRSGEQEITLVRSSDHGATWRRPETVSFRADHRDGMPVPLVLANRRGIVLAIEDSGLGGRFKPAIVYTSLRDNWRHPAVDGKSPRRWAALDPPLPRDVYAGAPYIRQLPSGETILSCQSDEGGRKPRMVVYIGDRNARGFSRRSVPFDLPPEVRGSWNSLFIKDASTVTAVSGTTVNGVGGIWTIDGRVSRGSSRGTRAP